MKRFKPFFEFVIEAGEALAAFGWPFLAVPVACSKLGIRLIFGTSTFLKSKSDKEKDHVE